MDARPLMDAMPRDFALTLVDVGSAGGLNPRWAPFAPILSSILFDPREREAAGGFGRGCTRIYPVALGNRSGEARLYQTAMANMSSFLEPDPDAFARFGRKKADAAVAGSEAVPMDRLDELAARDGFRPDVIKVDTQGSEMMVLEGAGSTLDSVTLAEVEVSLFQRYKGQPLLLDIAQHMAARGFELIDLLHLKRYRSSNSLRIRNAGLRGSDKSGRLAYADAIFLRREDQLLALGPRALLAAMVALVAYGKADMAARLLDLGREILPPGQAEVISQALTRLEPGPFRRWFGRRS